jgi:hypothetical protein
MKWVSVKDSLPEKYARVLVTDGETVCLHYKQSRWNFEGDEGSDLYSLGDLKDPNGEWGSCCHITEKITHWAPVPGVQDLEKK